MSEDRGSRGLAYQPALDGLRAFAVLAVFAYHLDAGWARGGFLGVDAFFVLSGFLITSLLLIEWDRTGTLSFPAFWSRRARRLLPALLLVLVAVAIYGAIELPADQLGRLRWDGLATLFYSANWRFIASGSSYFALFSEASPLRHAWSLAIEEQFYLVWPLVTFTCLRLGRGRRTVLTVVCAVAAVGSTTAMGVLYDRGDPSRAYYGTDTRAQLLLVGALLAVALGRWAPRTATHRALVQLWGLAGAVVCVVAWTSMSDTAAFMYRGGDALFGLAVAGVIAAGVQPRRAALAGMLSFGPLVWVGRISYGLYLWHWPVIVVADRARTHLHGAPLTVLRVALTFALATASFYLVEQPIRRGALRSRWAIALAPTAFLAAGLVVVVATVGAAAPPDYLRGPKEGEDVLASASEDVPATGLAVQTDPDAPPPSRMLLVGDSVADSLLPSLERVTARQGIDLHPAVVPGCGVVGGLELDRGGSLFSWSEDCERSVPAYESSRLVTVRPDVVVWLSLWDSVDRLVDGEKVEVGTIDGNERMAELVDETVTRLTATGARLVVVTLAPPPPDLVDAVPLIAEPHETQMNVVLRQYARAHPDRLTIVDLASIVCPDGAPCPESVEGVNLRPRDGRHFDGPGADWVADRLVPALLAASPENRGGDEGPQSANASVGSAA